MDVGRYFSLSAVANDGVLSLLAAVVVLLVLVWALSSPFWDIPEEPEAAHPGPHAAAPRQGAGPPDATSPIPRAIRAGAYTAPRHAAGPPRPPKVSGNPPWGPAPRPRGAPPVGWLSRPGAPAP
jgi:hypothetical protein